MIYFDQDAVASRIEIMCDLPVRANKMLYSYVFRGIIRCNENHRIYYNIPVIFS
jgi:hypothetical protein